MELVIMRPRLCPKPKAEAEVMTATESGKTNEKLAALQTTWIEEQHST